MQEIWECQNKTFISKQLADHIMLCLLVSCNRNVLWSTRHLCWSRDGEAQCTFNFWEGYWCPVQPCDLAVVKKKLLVLLPLVASLWSKGMVHTKCPEFRRQNDRPSASSYCNVTMVIFIYSQINISLILSWFIFFCLLVCMEISQLFKRSPGATHLCELNVLQNVFSHWRKLGRGSSSCQVF